MTNEQFSAIIRVIEREEDVIKLRRLENVIARRHAAVAPPVQQSASRRGRVGRSIPNEKGLIIGDEIKFTYPISPRYMIGLKGIVVGTNRRSVNVKTPDDPKYGRFKNKAAIRCSNDLVEKAEVGSVV